MDTPELDVRRHGIVLVRPFLRALALALAGGACFFAPWLAVRIVGAVLLALAAAIALLAVARWDRTHLVLSGDTLVVEHGLLRRSTASIALGPGTVVEVERSLLGRLLGYGTLVAGDLEIDCVPRSVASALQQRR